MRTLCLILSSVLLLQAAAAAAADTTPNAFMFNDRTNAARNITITSSQVTVQGIDAPAPISMTGTASAVFSINGGAYLRDARIVNAGDVVRLQMTSASTFNTARNAVLAIGGVSDTWSVRTLVEDTRPDPFAFTDVPAAALNSLITSSTITVAGINQPTSISIAGAASARYAVNGGVWRNDVISVHKGDVVQLRLHSATTGGVQRSATLTIGGVSAPWHVTTVTATGRWASAYYPCYRRYDLPPANIDYSALTHLVHWPVNPNADGTLNLDCYGNLLDATHSADVITPAHAAGTKVLLGVGGDQGSGATAGFQGATDAAHRATFVSNIVNLVTSRGYDGVDINWEVIGSSDAANFQAFIHDLRTALDTAQPGLLLTFVPAGSDGFLTSLTASVMADFDQINLQTYVMSGAYDGWVTWFNSPLHNGGLTFPCCGNPVPSIDAIVDAYEGAGIPAAKLGIASQFDAYVWSGGTGTSTGGAAQPRQGWTTAPSVTNVTYTQMLAQFTTAGGYTRTFDDVAKVPWLGKDVLGSINDKFISFDDEQAIQEKALYLRARGLGGFFAFELYGDYNSAATGTAREPLLNAIKTYVKQGYVQTP